MKKLFILLIIGVLFVVGCSSGDEKYRVEEMPELTIIINIKEKVFEIQDGNDIMTFELIPVKIDGYSTAYNINDKYIGNIAILFKRPNSNKWFFGFGDDGSAELIKKR